MTYIDELFLNAHANFHTYENMTIYTFDDGSYVIGMTSKRGDQSLECPVGDNKAHNLVKSFANARGLPSYTSTHLKVG